MLRSEDLWVGNKITSAVVVLTGMETMRNSGLTQAALTRNSRHTQTLNNPTADVDGTNVWVATHPCEYCQNDRALGDIRFGTFFFPTETIKQYL